MAPCGGSNAKQGTSGTVRLWPDMPRFFFHVRDGEPVDDPDGMFLPDMRSARLEAVRSARDFMAEDLRRGRLHLSSWIEVTDEQGEAIFALPFAEAVEIDR
jgi:hypothetical protein